MGVATVVVSALWLRSHNASELVQVVVAVEEIEAGVKLRPEYLKMTDWPKASLPHGAERSVDKLLERVTHTKIAANELVLERMLLPIGATGNLAAVIAPGMRAVTIPVNEVAGVAGFVFPGNYVDVLLNAKDDSGQSTSRIVLERVLVLAADQERSIKDESRGRVVKAVTLQVTPSEAERIDLARSVGHLSLALRSQEDGLAGAAGATGVGAKQGEFTGTTKAPKAAPVSGIEVIRGTKRSVASE